MEFFEIIIAIPIALVMCATGIFCIYLIYKQTLYTKIVAFIIYMAFLTMSATMVVTFGEFDIIRFVITGAIVGLLVHFPFNWYIRAVIFTPINKMNACVNALSKGDFSKTSDITSQDEFGELALNYNKSIADLSVLIKAVEKNSTDNLKMSEILANLSENVSEKADHTSQKSNIVAASARNMNSSMNAVAGAITQSSENMSTVSDAIESNTATINEIANSSDKAREITEKAVQQAQNASKSVQELGSAVQNIGKVTEAISEISEQTNLLALNATIEAARAGDAGKGFAVVASEIKDLARQTADSTLDIKNMIEEIRSTASRTVTEIEQITTVINDGNDLVNNIAASVEEQSVTTGEIARNVSQASQGMQEINDNVAHSLSASDQITGDIADVNEDARQMSDSTIEIMANTNTLSELAKALQSEIEKFTILSEPHTRA